MSSVKINVKIIFMLEQQRKQDLIGKDYNVSSYFAQTKSIGLRRFVR